MCTLRRASVSCPLPFFLSWRRLALIRVSRGASAEKPSSKTLHTPCSRDHGLDCGNHSPPKQICCGTIGARREGAEPKRLSHPFCSQTIVRILTGNFGSVETEHRAFSLRRAGLRWQRRKLTLPPSNVRDECVDSQQFEPNTKACACCRLVRARGGSLCPTKSPLRANGRDRSLGPSKREESRYV